MHGDGGIVLPAATGDCVLKSVALAVAASQVVLDLSLN